MQSSDWSILKTHLALFGSCCIYFYSPPIGVQPLPVMWFSPFLILYISLHPISTTAASHVTLSITLLLHISTSNEYNRRQSRDSLHHLSFIYLHVQWLQLQPAMWLSPLHVQWVQLWPLPTSPNGHYFCDGVLPLPLPSMDMAMYNSGPLPHSHLSLNAFLFSPPLLSPPDPLMVWGNVGPKAHIIGFPTGGVARCETMSALVSHGGADSSTPGYQSGPMVVVPMGGVQVLHFYWKLLIAIPPLCSFFSFPGPPPPLQMFTSHMTLEDLSYLSHSSHPLWISRSICMRVVPPPSLTYGSGNVDQWLEITKN
jgi:hypothetical protein